MRGEQTVPGWRGQISTTPGRGCLNSGAQHGVDVIGEQVDFLIGARVHLNGGPEPFGFDHVNILKEWTILHFFLFEVKLSIQTLFSGRSMGMELTFELSTTTWVTFDFVSVELLLMLKLSQCLSSHRVSRFSYFLVEFVWIWSLSTFRRSAPTLWSCGISRRRRSRKRKRKRRGTVWLSTDFGIEAHPLWNK